MLLPRVWTSFRRANAETEQLLGTMHRAAETLKSGDVAGANEALSAANRKLGLFVAQVDTTRRRALEAIAAVESARMGLDSGHAAIGQSLESLQESYLLSSQGNLERAMSMHRAAGRSLRRATAGLRSRSNFGGRGAGLLERPVDGTGAQEIAWKVLTRGELFEEEKPAGGKRREDMAYPREYRDLVRRYMSILKIGE